MKNVRGAFRIKISKVGFEREKYFVRDFFLEKGRSSTHSLAECIPLGHLVDVLVGSPPQHCLLHCILGNIRDTNWIADIALLKDPTIPRSKL